MFTDVCESRTVTALLSNSELSCWRRCRRKWWLAYYRHLSFGQTDYAHIMASGTRLHRVLAAWYVPNRPAGLDIFRVQADVIAEDRQSMMGSTPQESLESAVIAFDKAVQLERVIIEGYVQWLAETGADEEFTVISSEVPTAVQVDSGLTLLSGRDIDLHVYAIGIIDAQLQSADGRIYFLDHKTVGSLTEPLKTLHMSPQMLHYILLLRQLFPTNAQMPTGALYNMLRRVGRTARAKPPFYDRVFMPYSPQTISIYRAHMLGACRDMLGAAYAIEQWADHHSFVYPSPRNECAWDCPFFAVCPMFDDGSRAEDFLSRFYVKTDPLQRYRDALSDMPSCAGSTCTDVLSLFASDNEENGE